MRLPSALGFAVLGGLTSCNISPPDGASNGAIVRAAYMDTSDALMSSLADRAKSKFTGDSGFQIIVTDSAYPIGTLIRQGTSIPVDYKACLPSSPPPTAQSPSLFPNYDLSSKVGIELGIDSGVIAKLASAGVTVSNTKTISLHFADVNSIFLSDNDINVISALPVCKAALVGQKVWLVRGYFQAKRNFTLKTDTNRSTTASLTSIGHFTVDFGTGNASVGLSDDAPQQFLQVVSEVVPPTVPGTSAKVSKPKIIVAVNDDIFIQRQEGGSDNGAETVAALKAASFKVEPFVQPIGATKMPSLPQVRYFNPADLAKAKRVLTILKTQYPDAVLKPIKLSAPTGQLEVWLRKEG